MGLKVPEDISVVGIDNHELAEFFGITTVDQNVKGQAEALVKVMLELLENEDEERESVLEWPIELVVRSSTAKAKN
jgi:DNA-binding LacI/PurR family transcriptional regulator